MLCTCGLLLAAFFAASSTRLSWQALVRQKLERALLEGPTAAVILGSEAGSSCDCSSRELQSQLRPAAKQACSQPAAVATELLDKFHCKLLQDACLDQVGGGCSSTGRRAAPAPGLAPYVPACW